MRIKLIQKKKRQRMAPLNEMPSICRFSSPPNIYSFQYSFQKGVKCANKPGCNHSPAIQFNWHIAGSEIVRKCAPAPLERRHKLLSLNWYLSLSVECMSGPSGPLSLSLPHYLLLLSLSISLPFCISHQENNPPLIPLW